MDALDAPWEGGRPPPFPIADTAAASSELASAPLSPRPVRLPLEPRKTSDQTVAFPELPPLPKAPLPSPRCGRSFSLAQTSGPIKRKPLSSAASPVAVRYSTRGYADIADLPRPEQRFARSCSLDSPTLYEFPGHRSLLATSLLNTVVDWPASPDSSQPSTPVTEHIVQPGVLVDGTGDVHLRNIAGSNPAASQTTHTLSVDESSAETASLTTQNSDPYELEYLYSDPDSPESRADKRTTIINTNTKTMSMFARKSPPPHLKLGTPERIGRATTNSLELSNLNKPLPKSPASSSKLSAFLGWDTSVSPSTTNDDSDKGFSPLPSPSSPKPTTVRTNVYETPPTAKSPAFSNATEQNSLDYCEAYLQTPSDSTTSWDEVEEMEDELKAISAELASSIRRELDLDDLVERLQEQINSPQAPGKRTSDYFSDSGYSSAKFNEFDNAKEEISQIQRRAEQEKAQIRLELTNKLSDERSRRRRLDQQIQELSKRASQVDVVQFNNDEASGRVRELEITCDDLSRRLSEEREAKNSFQDLLEALKGEMQTVSSERDDLRDEIVPQLRARVEGLEAEVAEQSKLAYETSKIQQELQVLRSENAEHAKTADDASKIQQELQALRSENAEHAKTAHDASRIQQELQDLRFENVEHAKTADNAFKIQQELQVLRSNNAEQTKTAYDTAKIEQELELLRSEHAEHAKVANDTSKMQHELQLLRSENAELKQSGTRMSMALSRSASVTGGMFRKNSRPQSVSRSISTRQPEPREALAERLKDVEAQRDALHNALKSLLERQELQTRENAKRVRQLEMERDRLLSASPKKAGYEREVSKLREEISVLRRRAEEAIEQKWQVEKGLGGLKMDLDRAEEEIESLRTLLKEKEIVGSTRDSSTEHNMPASSASLEKAYQDLQAAYSEALQQIKTLEDSTISDEQTQLAMQRLEQALLAALSDRDLARTETASYRNQLDTFQMLEKNHLDAERNLADQLHESAQRVEDLAQQVRAQLEANATLRARLGDTIARGEAEQRFSTERIAGMQSRLRTLEDQVVAAQTGAEERVTRHEEELGRLRDAHSTQLQRLRDASGGLRASGQQRLFPPKSPLSPMFSSRAMARSPTRMSTPAMGLTLPPHHQAPRPGIHRSTTEPADMMAQVETLRGRVAELEGALAAADAEMQEVVGRMSAAQIEVLMLQEEREAAVRETRRLQVLLQGETMRVFKERFRSLGSRVA